MPDFKLRQIHAVMLGDRELARSVEFYRDKLGMRVKNQSANFASLGAGGVMLMLSLPLARAGESLSGATEAVFSVESVRAAC